MERIFSDLPHKYDNPWYPKSMLTQLIYFAQWQGFTAKKIGDYLNYEDATCTFKIMFYRFQLVCPQPEDKASPFCVWTLTGSRNTNITASFYPKKITLKGTMDDVPSFIAGGDVNGYITDSFKQILKMMY